MWLHRRLFPVSFLPAHFTANVATGTVTCHRSITHPALTRALRLKEVLYFIRPSLTPSLYLSPVPEWAENGQESECLPYFFNKRLLHTCTYNTVVPDNFCLHYCTAFSLITLPPCQDYLLLTRLHPSNLGMPDVQCIVSTRLT
jgi:hypothetical protein